MPMAGDVDAAADPHAVVGLDVVEETLQCASVMETRQKEINGKGQIPTDPQEAAKCMFLLGTALERPRRPTNPV